MRKGILGLGLMRDMADSVVPPQPRDYHGWNWSGFFTLYQREIRRFWKVGTQTVAAPVVTTLLYMMVFVVAVGPARQAVDGVSFGHFVAPGLIMMAILNNAFANSSSSLIQAKIQQRVIDWLKGKNTVHITAPETDIRTYSLIRREYSPSVFRRTATRAASVNEEKLAKLSLSRRCALAM